MVNPTDFVIHEEVAQHFTVQTNLRDKAGQYTITISSLISVPDDYTLQTETEFVAETTLVVNVIDPCATTGIIEFDFNDISVKVNDEQFS